LDFEKSYSKVKRWERVAKASAEQCARADLPAVSQIKTLESFLEEDDAKGVKLFAYERRERCVPLDEVLSGNPQVTVIVGPEGGFEPSEVLSMIESGYLPVSIGPFLFL
jgi:16S rRNA (uracil1498-N3)-methyltransferase